MERPRCYLCRTVPPDGSEVREVTCELCSQVVCTACTSTTCDDTGGTCDPCTMWEFGRSLFPEHHEEWGAVLKLRRRAARSANFAVPFGLSSEERLVRVSEARPDEAHRCPLCRSNLTARRGKVRAHHFAHERDSQCTLEQVVALTARHLLRQAVDDWKCGRGPTPHILRNCCVCQRSRSRQALPELAAGCLVDISRNDASGDVAVVGAEPGGAPLALISVCMVYRDVHDARPRAGERWLAVAVDATLADPLTWRPLRQRLKPYVCPGCGAQRKSELAEVAQLQTRHRVSASAEYYPAPIDCYRCSKRTVVYAWGDSTWESERPPPAPVPRSVQRRTSQTAGTYWANTCFACGAMQGDYFLHHESGGPFSRIPRGDDENEHIV